MKDKCLKRGIVLAALFSLAMVCACNDSPNGPGNSDGPQISFSVKYFGASRTNALPKFTAGVAAVDSITITRARLVLSKIDFEGGDENSEDDDMEFRTPPMVIELNLTGAVQQVMIANVPAGTYDEIEFKIHRVDSADIAVLSPADQAAFADFITGERYSVIIAGLTYSNGAAQSFVFNSKIEAKQEYDLNPPLVVTDANTTTNLTLAIEASQWFVNGNGVLLDPNDGANRSAIEASLKRSLKLYQDDDRDGDDDYGDDDGDD